MCIKPTTEIVYRDGMRTAETINIPCGICWQCKKQRVNDFVGRMLCEKSVSSAVACITLTYADKPERKYDLAHKRIYPRHFQNFIKHLRWQGYKLKYFTAAEYGAKRGRAHFHSILFFQPSVKKPNPPDWVNQQNINIGPAWAHGHSFVDWEGTAKACRYVCKYILKEDNSENWISMSKKPYLGHQFIMQMVQRNIETKTPPVTFNYRPPGEDNTKTKYWLQGAQRRDYCLQLFDDWQEQIGPFPWERIPPGVQKVIASAIVWRETKEGVIPTTDQFVEQLRHDLHRTRQSSPRKQNPYYWDEDHAIKEIQAREMTKLAMERKANG